MTKRIGKTERAERATYFLIRAEGRNVPTNHHKILYIIYNENKLKTTSFSERHHPASQQVIKGHRTLSFGESAHFQAYFPYVIYIMCIPKSKPSYFPTLTLFLSFSLRYLHITHIYHRQHTKKAKIKNKGKK